MTVGDIFSPFAQKYVLRKERLYSKTGGALALDIDLDLNFRWGGKNNNLYGEIARDFEELANADFTPFSEEGACVVEDQPCWDMSKSACEVPREGEGQTRRVEKRLGSEAEAQGPSPCRKWRMEHLAYYCPAHTSKPDRYGIHLTKRGIAKAASQVHQLCPNQPLEIVQLAAVYALFVHEMCHAWIEDICCLLDFAAAETAPKLARRYVLTQQRYHSYIFMEEAICNTAVYGWLRHFLGKPGKQRPHSMPAFNPGKILEAFGQWMRTQPKGYRDFLPIKQLPHQSEDFVRNVCRLLKEVYGADAGRSRGACEVCDALGVFFGGHVTPDCRHFMSLGQNRWDTFWLNRNLPVHVEG